MRKGLKDISHPGGESRDGARESCGETGVQGQPAVTMVRRDHVSRAFSCLRHVREYAHLLEVAPPRRDDAHDGAPYDLGPEEGEHGLPTVGHERGQAEADEQAEEGKDAEQAERRELLDDAADP